MARNTESMRHAPFDSWNLEHVARNVVFEPANKIAAQPLRQTCSKCTSLD